MYTKGQTRRFDDALAIQQGACNPSGIVYSLMDAFKEIADENGDTRTKRDDPAIRLMVHQLAYLCGIAAIDNEPNVYSDLVTACESRVVISA
jgi:hypothetical protein